MLDKAYKTELAFRIDLKINLFQKTLEIGILSTTGALFGLGSTITS